jgi:M6 family metalloprotease-like protein
MNTTLKIACFISAVAVAVRLAMALPYTMPANPNPYSEKNADGSRTPLIRLLGRGESGGYNSTVEVTLDGFAVSKVNGNYMYMELDESTGKLMSSGLVAGRDHPSFVSSVTSGKKLGRFSIERSKDIMVKSSEMNQRRLIANIEKEHGIPSEHSHVSHRRTAVIGNKVNLMIPFKFLDHTSRIVPSTADLNVLMNSNGPHALCPTGSVRDVYLISSYNQLVLQSTVSPWVTLPNTEAYYANGNSGLNTVAHIMVQDALNSLQATGFDFRPFDTDSDGYIDAIGFLHSGYGAEWGGTDAYGNDYSRRIWSHKWALYSLPGGQWTSTTGKKVYNYHISPSVWGTSGSAIGRIGVIAHETGHFFGLPDLYDGSGGTGIGSYCLMANSWGFDGSQYYPPHMSAWSKIQFGWVTPTLIATSGTYTARQSCTYPDIFKISSNFPSGEFLLIENRQRCNFDSDIPGPGLAIFHIDESASFTQEGYPGQSGWPANGYHYRVALLQADGSYDLEKGQNRGDATDLFYSGGVNGISSTGTTAGVVNPNTKAYKGGTIINTGISITGIGASSSSMSFLVGFGQIPPTPAPTPPPANQFSLTLMTDGYSSEDSSWTLSLVDSRGSTLIASKPTGAYGNNALYTEKYVLGAGNYAFDMNDAWGDGLLSPAYYTISLGGQVLKTGSGYGFFIDSTTFTVTTVQSTTEQPVSSPIIKPIAPKPKPSVSAPIPKLGAPKPIPKPAAPKPKPSVSAPIPKLAAPKPIPKPAAPKPKPSVSAPIPKLAVPKPILKPAVPKPKLSVSVPIPKPAAPKPKPPASAPIPKPAVPKPKL